MWETWVKDLERVCARAAQDAVCQHNGKSWTSLHSLTKVPFARGAGEKILVIEDAFLLRELVCDYLLDCGLEPVGPASRLQEGCNLARERELDGAILDVKLREGPSFPIAAILKARGIPFVFVTGYHERSQIPPEFRSAPLVCKPFDDDELGAALNLILGRPAQKSLVPLLAGQVPAFDAGRLTTTVSAKA